MRTSGGGLLDLKEILLTKPHADVDNYVAEDNGNKCLEKGRIEWEVMRKLFSSPPACIL